VRLEEVETPMIICHCEAVSDRSVTAAVSSGARTLAQVCRTTGAGRDCGACVFTVRRVLTDHLDAAAPVETGDSAA
jgi:bacterioferritin-associated ferredoxin